MLKQRIPRSSLNKNTSIRTGCNETQQRYNLHHGLSNSTYTGHHFSYRKLLRIDYAQIKIGFAQPSEKLLSAISNSYKYKRAGRK
jgi:hypothetical protein